MTSDTEKQTLMGFAYDIRQSLKDSEYKELVELIMEKEQNKQKFVKITYRKVKVGDDEMTGCIVLNYTLPHTTIFEIMPVERANLKGWDSTKITQEELDAWEHTSFIHPTVEVLERGQGEWIAVKNKQVLWVMEARESV
tara:strand:- start:6145 stop:6561 length:417 start_codon:yes stop_codon:yes gene_type:complete